MSEVLKLETAPGSEHTVYQTNGDDDTCLGTIAIPVLDRMPAPSVISLLHTDYRWVPADHWVDRAVIHGSSVLTLARNECVQRMKGDWLLFIDDDMVWDPDAIQRLVEAREEGDFDILGALCFRRSPPYQPTLYMREQPNSGRYNYLERWGSDIVEVDATGMAFVIIHKRVFERIAGTPMPPWAERQRIGPTNFFRWDGILGEDLRFCQDARATGSRIFVDTRIQIGHVADVIIDHQNFLTELAFRPKDVVAIRQVVNDDMGLPTVTPEEAREELDGR